MSDPIGYASRDLSKPARKRVVEVFLQKTKTSGQISFGSCSGFHYKKIRVLPDRQDLAVLLRCALGEVRGVRRKKTARKIRATSETLRQQGWARCPGTESDEIATGRVHRVVQ